MSRSQPTSSTPRAGFLRSILIKELGLESSTSNARRVIEQGGFNVGPERETISDPKALIYVSDGLIVRVGKRKIARIRLV